jgi:hypothetical protein
LHGEGTAEDDRRRTVAYQADQPETHAKLAFSGCEGRFLVWAFLVLRIVMKTQLNGETNDITNKAPKGLIMALSKEMEVNY